MRPGEVDLKRLLPRTAGRAWTLRCPACGARGVFQRYAKLRAACPSCGHVLRREQGSQTGSMYLTAAVNQVFAALVILAVFAGTDWSLATQLAVSIPVVVAFCALFLPFSQTIWAGVEYVTDCINAEPWIVRREGPREDA
jgi:uncharacterized protein (DUF983 family)